MACGTFAAGLGAMDFRILGPLEVHVGGRPVALGGAKPRALLAILLLNANKVVSSDRLIDELWGEDPPPTAAKGLQGYVSGLRKALEAATREVLVTRPPGYAIELDPQQLDLTRFERLRSEAREALAGGDAQRAAATLHEALGLWRGPPLADFAYAAFAQTEIDRLEELRLTALEERIEADLALGRHADLAGEIEGLIDQHPLRERLRGQLMLALYRSGRQAEALQAYQDARVALTEELGIEPRRELRELHQAVLTQDASLDAPPRLEAAVAAGPEPNRSAFVGRESELAELLAGVESAVAGRGGLYLLEGEPGIGKSRLAEELTVHARARGAYVLVGRCWEAGGAPAYWPWVQSLRSYIAERDAEHVREELGAGAAELTQLLPELGDLESDISVPPASDPEAARFRLFDAAASFLARAAADRPIVLVLDDLHAADEPSLLLLQFLARGLDETRLLVVAAYRDVDPTLRDPLSSALAELTRERSTRRIALAGLAESDVAEYISLTAGVAPEPATVAAIHAQTEGNALFVDEVTRLLIAEGGLGRGLGASVGIPQGVRDVIHRRLRRLPPDCRETLTMASVLGREFEVETLAHMSGSEPRDVLELLDHALESRAVAEVPGLPGRLRFSHALVRDTLYDELTPARRLDLHSRAGEALTTLYAGNEEPHLAELAYHFAEAAAVGGEAKRAVRYARRAGERAAALLAFEEATRLYRLALRLTDPHDREAQPARCELLVMLGDVQARAGEMPAARETFLEAAAVAQEANLPEALARSALGYGGRFVFTRGASDPHLVPLLERAVQALGDEDSALRVRVLSRLASAQRDDWSREPRAALSAQALQTARRLGDPATLAYALNGHLSAVMAPDSFDERLALATELSMAADKEHALEGHLHRTVVLLGLGDLAGVRDELVAVEQLASELRQPTQRWLTTAVAVLLAILDGRLGDAEAGIRRAHALGERAQRYETLSFFFLQEFGLRREQGRLAEIADELEGAPAEFPTRPVYRCALAACHVELGRLDEARKTLTDLAGDEFHFAALALNNDLLLSLALLTEVAIACEDSRAAESLYALLLPYAELNVDTLELTTGAVARHLGMLAGALDRIADAVAHFEKALEMNARMGARLWVAHTECDLARALIERGAQGDGKQAEALVAAARETSRELGLTAVERKLRSIGSIPATAP